MVKARDESFAIGSAHGMRWVTTKLRAGAEYTTGIVVTEHGIVSVYTQIDAQSDDQCYSRYDFAWKYRQHVRYDRNRTERGLTIEAAKFARRVVGESARRGVGA